MEIDKYSTIVLLFCFKNKYIIILQYFGLLVLSAELISILLFFIAKLVKFWLFHSCNKSNKFYLLLNYLDLKACFNQYNIFIIQ